LDAGGSHTLERLVTEVARDVQDPRRAVSVLERLRARDLVDAKNSDERKEIRDRALLRIDALGSGSDFTPFLQHAGIASLDIGYSGEAGWGAYHSAYDTFEHYVRFGDPTFEYGVTQAKTTGRIVLRLANADTLPFETTTFADTVARYATEVRKLADTKRADTEERNREIREKTLEIAADPAKPFIAPKEEEAVPHLEFAPLENAVAHLQKSARAFDAKPKDDRVLMHLEQHLTRDEGLPDRGWYRHQVYAPGFYTGYGVKTLPAIREAIEQRKWSEANAQIAIVAKVLEGYAAELDRAANP
ncbi:MAG TPA: transferrin receptor-like dimerization domain-containing protein, partial [Thermoanaerobaculia bacterium]|nr:transferrin receptor-like dimerization domain-containing protein [Thermoanaerobaculia bacterium]